MTAEQVTGLVANGRAEAALEIVEAVAHEDCEPSEALDCLTLLGLNADDAALGRAVEAMQFRDEVLGCPSQVERYVDVSPIEGVHRASERFVDDQQDVLDLAVQELAS